MRNQLGVLLEIPSSTWQETNRNHTQKDGAKPAMNSRNNESSTTTQKDAQTMSNEYKNGYFETQPSFPKEEKLGIMPQISYSFLPISPECIRTAVNQRNRVQEAGLTDLENQMEQAEIASRHLINIEIATDSLLLKENSKMKVWKLQMNQRIKSAECIIALSCRRQSFHQSPWGRPRWEATLPRCCWRPQPATALTALLWWWHDEDWNVISSSRDALPAFKRVTINSVI